MNKLDEQYQRLISQILLEGSESNDRTGVGTLSIAGAQIRHNMAEGFPLLTVRKVPYRSVRVELEGFINGINSKKWYQDRNCSYWKSWCNPQKVPYGTDEETKTKMLAEDDLGIIYGNNWRGFHDPTGVSDDPFCGVESLHVDQLSDLVKTLKADPNSRRMMVYAWNPLALDHAALPACHDSFQVTVTENKLNLIFRMRSSDAVLGLPSNLASYGTLLHLLAKESGFQEGYLVAHLGDIHIYKNALDAAQEYLKREPFELPRIFTEGFTSIFDWTHDQTKAVDYKAHDRIKVEVAV